jgi:uncharacterized protein (UPF0332 family)
VAYPIVPERLLRQARQLAGVGAAGRPIHHNLRRSASSTYYAVFHQVTMSAAQLLLSHSPKDMQWEFSRRIHHQSVSKVCEYIATNKNPSASSRLTPLLRCLRTTPVVVVFATDFLALQDARLRADYDHAAIFSKPEVVSLIERAEICIATLGSLAGTQQAQSLYVMVALTDRGS